MTVVAVDNLQGKEDPTETWQKPEKSYQMDFIQFCSFRTIFLVLTMMTTMTMMSNTEFPQFIAVYFLVDLMRRTYGALLHDRIVLQQLGSHQRQQDIEDAE